MRPLLFFLFFVVGSISTFGQNLYPYIQRPTENSATIAWRRNESGTSILRYGLSPTNLDQVVTGPDTRKHAFDLYNLMPNTKYYYQTFSAGVTDTFESNVEFFYTAAPEDEQDFTFLAYGDCGYNNSIQHDIADLMEAETEAAFAIVTGDVDQNIGDNYDEIFFGVYDSILKNECHFTCIGNHDTYADNAQTYMDYFYLPYNNPDSTERYYSFVWGDAKFICLDANLDYSIGSAQHNWMLDELRCNDRKWLFVYCHQPPWTNAWSADYFLPGAPYFLYEGDEDMRTDIVPFLEEYKVDFMVNGHSHCYQRGEHNGVQYLITGGAGASTMDNNTNSDAPNISVEIYENHYVRFEISGDTARYFMVNRNAVVRDQVEVIKNYTPYATSFSVNDASCPASTDGSATLTVEGPHAPYSIEWETGDTTNTVSGLSVGTYNVFVTDARGCMQATSVTIEGPTPPNFSIQETSGENVICTGATTTLSASGGSFTDFAWSTGETSNNIMISNAGTYTLTVADNAGCNYTQTVDIEEITTPVGDFTYVSDSLGVLFTGMSTDGLLYTWDFGDGNTLVQSGNGAVHYYDQEGTYTVQLIVSNPCGQDTITQNVTLDLSNVQHLNLEYNHQVQVHPNPFSDQTTLSFPNPENALHHVKIINLQGQTVQNYLFIKGDNVNLQVGSLPVGLYLYELQGVNYNTLATGKLIIQE